MPDFAKLKVVPIYSVAMYLELELKARWAVAREMPDLPARSGALSRQRCRDFGALRRTTNPEGTAYSSRLTFSGSAASKLQSVCTNTFDPLSDLSCQIRRPLCHRVVS